jgi:hypothetical protein
VFLRRLLRLLSYSSRLKLGTYIISPRIAAGIPVEGCGAWLLLTIGYFATRFWATFEGIIGSGGGVAALS